MYPTGLEAHVIRNLARQDLELAGDLFPNVRKGRTIIRAYGSIEEQYIDNGSQKKAFNIGLQLSDKVKLSTFSLFLGNGQELIRPDLCS